MEVTCSRDRTCHYKSPEKDMGTGQCHAARDCGPSFKCIRGSCQTKEGNQGLDMWSVVLKWIMQNERKSGARELRRIQIFRKMMAQVKRGNNRWKAMLGKFLQGFNQLPKQLGNLVDRIIVKRHAWVISTKAYNTPGWSMVWVAS